MFNAEGMCVCDFCLGEGSDNTFLLYSSTNATGAVICSNCVARCVHVMCEHGSISFTPKTTKTPASDSSADGAEQTQE